MKAAKSGKATKVMKVVKAKRVSKIAKGKYAKALVLRGSEEKTQGGLRKDMIIKNKRGKLVSKKDQFRTDTLVTPCFLIQR